MSANFLDSADSGLRDVCGPRGKLTQSITHFHSLPSLGEHLLADFEQRAVSPHELQLRSAFVRSEVRELLALPENKLTVIVPLMPRDVNAENGKVIRTIAAEHRRLLAESGNTISFHYVFNDNTIIRGISEQIDISQTLTKLTEHFNQFLVFFKENCWGDPDRQIDPGTLRSCFTFTNMNDEAVQEALVSEGRTRGCGQMCRSLPGKGNAVALGVAASQELHRAKIVLIHDADIRNFAEIPLIPSLVLPILEHSQIAATKASFVRLNAGKLNGRLTRGFSDPIIKAMAEYFEDRANETTSATVTETAKVVRAMAEFRYPLSGEIAIRVEHLAKLQVHPSYGLESRMLIEWGEMAARGGVPVGCVAISRYEHHHSPMGTSTPGSSSTGLFRMLEDVYDGLVRPLIENGRATLQDFGNFDLPNCIIDRAAKIRNEHLIAQVEEIRSAIRTMCRAQNFGLDWAISTINGRLGLSPEGEQGQNSISDEAYLEAREQMCFEFGFPHALVDAVRLKYQLIGEQKDAGLLRRFVELLEADGVRIGSRAALLIPPFVEDVTTFVAARMNGTLVNQDTHHRSVPLGHRTAANQG